MSVNTSSQNTQNMSTTSSITPRTQVSSGRGAGSMQTSRHLESRRSGSRNNNAQGDPNARVNVSSRKRNNNPRRKQTHQPSNHQRGQSDPGATNNGRSSSQSSSGDSESNQVEELHSSVMTTASALNDLSLNDVDPALYGAPARRGQISLNHLLNFSFPPRQQSVYSAPRKQRATNYQPFNKERFVNANFRFLVSSMGDYTVYQVDPDLLLQWENIEQVIITTISTPSCPICLQQPTAARVTKCGHTFCLPCVLHYLMLTDDEKKPNKKWRRCPICWDSVYAKDLKSVRFWAVRSIKSVGDGGLVNGDEMITMRLIQRNANSTLALPRSSTWPSRDEISTPWHFFPDVLIFSKLMLASPGYMQDEYNKDLKDLQDMLQDSKSFNSTEEIPFIEMAMVNIRDHLVKLQASPKVDVAEAERRAREFITMSESIGKGPLNPEEKSSQKVRQNNIGDDKELFEPENVPPPFLPDEFREQPHIANIFSHPKPDQKLKAKFVQPIVSNDGVYHFYQSEDGQHIYLHPLDIRVLKQEFGTYERFPNEITIKIIGVEETTITEEFRKRCKYLGHLPLSCDVTFLEVDLKGVVSDLTLQGFSRELQQRNNRRKEKARKEKRLHEIATHKERRRNGDRQELDDNDPFFQPNSFGGSGSTSSFPNSNYSGPLDVIENGSSEGSTKNNNNNTPTSYSGPKTVWGTPVVSFANVTPSSKVVDGHDNFDNIWNTPEEEVYVGKKHKKKKLVLMSTGGRRQL